jgi:hypothetical protein
MLLIIIGLFVVAGLFVIYAAFILSGDIAEQEERAIAREGIDTLCADCPNLDTCPSPKRKLAS